MGTELFLKFWILFSSLIYIFHFQILNCFTWNNCLHPLLLLKILKNFIFFLQVLYELLFRFYKFLKDRPQNEILLNNFYYVILQKLLITFTEVSTHNFFWLFIAIHTLKLYNVSNFWKCWFKYTFSVQIHNKSYVKYT